MKEEEKTVEVKFTCTEEEYEMIKNTAKKCSIPIDRFVMASIYHFDGILKGNN